MNNKHASLLRKISTVELQKIMDESTSLSNVVARFGLPSAKTHYISILKDRISTEQLSVEKMNENFKNTRLDKSRVNVDEIFTENSKYPRGIVRNKVIRLNLIEYRCAECPIVDLHNGKKLSLQLDHINGVRTDHRLSNLRWLCPNCHSQQDTSFGRGKGNNKHVTICECGSIVKLGGLECRSCSNKNRARKLRFDVTKEELEALVRDSPMSTIARMFGVSDTAVKKRCVKLGIALEPMRGYWAKKRSSKIE